MPLMRGLILPLTCVFSVDLFLYFPAIVAEAAEVTHVGTSAARTFAVIAVDFIRRNEAVAIPASCACRFHQNGSFRIVALRLMRCQCSLTAKDIIVAMLAGGRSPLMLSHDIPWATSASRRHLM